MKNFNPIHNRFMRLALYTHKRRNGATVFVRRKVQVDADSKTGQTGWTIMTWRVNRVVVLPAKYQREAKMNAAAMTANRAIVQGGGYDTSGRHFIFDRREVPADLVLKKDDWIVFNDRHYDIDSIVDYEFDTAWLVIGKELKGRVETIDEIHNPLHVQLTAGDQLTLSDNSDTVP
jgi:hypothetical protein